MKIFKKLQKDNQKLRLKISNILKEKFRLPYENIDYKKLWVLINELINNEIQQEELCNE